MKHLIGAHTSINGGVDAAVDLAQKLNFSAMQIFTKNNNRWFADPLKEDVIKKYKEKLKQSDIKFVVSHDSYLINLCAKEKENLEKSRTAFLDEYERCHQLGIEYLNFHPGSHGGVRYDKVINFMSNNTKSYRQLSNDEFVEQIKVFEEEISSREYYFIPEEKIISVEEKINHGDLIAITTNIDGLDIAHVGIAVKKNGRTHFMHAPMVGKKVEITEKPLADYVKANKRQHGIMVARPLEP